MQGVSYNEFSTAFIQSCLTPRVKLSPQDSLYCFRFLERMIDIKIDKANVFHVFSFINKIFYPVI